MRTSIGANPGMLTSSISIKLIKQIYKITNNKKYNRNKYALGYYWK